MLNYKNKRLELECMIHGIRWKIVFTRLERKSNIGIGKFVCAIKIAAIDILKKYSGID